MVIPCIVMADDLDVLYLHAEKENPAITEPVQLAVDALGINIRSISEDNILDTIDSKQIAGVVISSEVTLLEAKRLRKFLESLPMNIPVLFTGLRNEHQQPLRLLGFPISVEQAFPPHFTSKLIVHNISYTSSLGGLHLLCNVNENYHLVLPGSIKIISIGDRGDFAQYVEMNMGKGRQYFFLSDSQISIDNPLMVADNTLLQSIPYLIYFSRIGKDRVWQGSSLFANLTIDDPFLVEPYGNLSFDKLLQQMDAHRFHTTIAFIPRNFDRNEQSTVTLFRNRPDRFSIAVHGNNHDRWEFYRYFSKDWIEPYSTKTIPEQKQNLTQALVRMNEFSRITGISYDPVMIFPQGIAPAPTLEILKQIGYIATINGSNVPLDSEVPHRLQMSYRPFNTEFYSFLSLKRVGVNYYSELRIRTDLFLHNPLLIYSHQDYFEPGIERFNSVADSINSISPEIEWASLGRIVSRWHLWRNVANNIYEIQMLAPFSVIVNNSKDARHYQISKKEDSVTKILSITVNGMSIPWKREAGNLHFSLDLPPGGSGQIMIHYNSSVHSDAIGLNDGNSMLVSLWRGLSEFRDRVLSRFQFGIVVRDFLYNSGIAIWLPILFVTLLTIIVAGVVIWRFRLGYVRRKT